MSVIIKGMEMPVNCGDCDCYVNNGNSCWCVLTGMDVYDKSEVDPDCPLVEIPKNHGRIIDEMELFKQAPGKMTHHHEKGFDWEIRNANRWLKDNVPTILDAEGEE